MLPLDVIDARENTNIDMLVFWQIIYMSSLFMNTLVIPFAYFFFNTDEDVDHVSFYPQQYLTLYVIALEN
jgi:hypothetical protein